MHFMVVSSAIRRLSSHKPVGEPYAIIRSDAVTFWKKGDCCISSLLEDRSIGFHVVNNSSKQSFRHAEASPEHVREEGTTRHKVVEHELLVALEYAPTKCRTTNLWSWTIPLRFGWCYPFNKHQYYLVFFGVYDFTLRLGARIWQQIIKNISSFHLNIVWILCHPHESMRC